MKELKTEKDNEMNRCKIFVALFYCAVISLLFFAPVTATAAPFQEVYLTEDPAGVPHTEQQFVIVDASGAVTEYVYNYKGLLVKETNPLGEVTTYEYDALGRLSKKITPDGTLTTYTYDITGNVAKITAQKITGEVEELQYAYTREGYLVSAISKTTADEYTYTESGEIASVTRNGKYRIELCHDDAGKLVELRECHLDGRAEDSVTNYEYDSSHRLVKVIQDGNLLSEYGYDTAGRLKYQQDGTGSITEYSYGSSNRPVLMETRTAEGIVLYREENCYNEKGSVITRVVSGIAPEVSGTAGIFYFSYDEYDRLVQEQGIYGTISYTYDVMGNRLTRTENGVTTHYTYDLCNKLVSERIEGEVTYYVYDAMGNLIKKNAPNGTTMYSYNAFNQLEQVKTPSGDCQENEYDAMGIRSALTENGVATQYMTYNGMVLAAYNTAGERTEHYSYGKKILARE